MVLQVCMLNGNMTKVERGRYYLATRWINLDSVSDITMVRWAFKSYLRVLILKVASQASSAINKVAVSAF